MTFTADNQPDPEKKKRGKSFKNLLLDTIREKSLLDVPDTADRDEAQKAFIGHAAERAFDKDDQSSSTILRELLNKSFPGLKSTMPTIEFDLPKDSSPIQKANAILEAVSSGVIAPDVGALLIQAAKYTIDIEMGTELKDRIEKIEESLSLV